MRHAHLRGEVRLLQDLEGLGPEVPLSGAHRFYVGSDLFPFFVREISALLELKVQRVFSFDGALVLDLGRGLLALQHDPQWACPLLLEREDLSMLRGPSASWGPFAAQTQRLRGGRLVGVRQLGRDRVLRLDFRPSGARVGPLSLVLEVMGGGTNLYLLEDGKVLSFARAVRHRDRALEVGSPYVPPSAPFYSKAIASLVGEEEMRALEGELFEGRFQVQWRDGFLFAWPREVGLSLDPSRAWALLRAVKLQGRSLQARRWELERDLKRLSGRRERLKALLEEARSSLEETRRAPEVLRLAQLLASNLGLLGRWGGGKVSLVDWESGEEVEVDLPGEDPSELVSSLFREYEELKRREDSLEGRVRALELKLSELEAEEARVEEELASLTSLRLSPCGAKGRPPRRTSPRRADRSAPPEGVGASSPSLLAYAYGGFEVLVGRSEESNYLLTFREAAREDLFLHARDVPGAHVIVKSGGRRVPEEVVQFAASLAAFHSRARNSAWVDVDVVRRKHVRHLEGGRVSYRGESTVRVSPFAWSRMLADLGR